MEWFKDPHWLNAPVQFEGAEKWNTIKENVVESSLIASVNGQDVGYVDTMNIWVPLVSSTYALRMMQMAGNDKASVNFSSAFLPYADLFYKGTLENCVLSCPVSVCVGTRRLVLEWDRQSKTVRFGVCPPLINVGQTRLKLPVYIFGICSLPATHIATPASFNYPAPGEWYRHIEPFFPDKRDLVTYLWTIGNSLVDPIVRPRCVMLCGPGGSGKSTSLRGVRAALGTACGLLPDNFLLHHGSGAAIPDARSREIALVVVSSRMVICFEIDLSKGRANMSVMKNITGGDYVKVGSQMSRSLTSLMIATNTIPNHEADPEFFSDALMRRVVLMMMSVDTSAAEHVPDPMNPIARLNLLCNAVTVRLMYDHMPISPLNVMLTLCGSKYYDALSVIEESPSGVITPLEGRDALNIIAAICSTTSLDIENKARFISKSCVASTDLGLVIKGLRPISE